MPSRSREPEYEQFVWAPQVGHRSGAVGVLLRSAAENLWQLALVESASAAQGRRSDFQATLDRCPIKLARGGNHRSAGSSKCL